MLGGKRATGKCRVDKKRKRMRKKYGRIRVAWERGGSGGGMENRKGVVHEGLSVRIIFTEKEEKEEEEEEKLKEDEEEEEEKKEVEEETLPLFDVAGETKNGG